MLEINQPAQFTMDAYQKLEALGSDLTRRIKAAESSGNQPLVDRLLKLKLRLNRTKARHVIISYLSRKDAALQPGS